MRIKGGKNRRLTGQGMNYAQRNVMKEWRKIPPYEPCGCGSGKQFKFCCYQKKDEGDLFQDLFWKLAEKFNPKKEKKDEGKPGEQSDGMRKENIDSGGSGKKNDGDADKSNR